MNKAAIRARTARAQREANRRTVLGIAYACMAMATCALVGACVNGAGAPRTCEGSLVTYATDTGALLVQEGAQGERLRAWTFATEHDAEGMARSLARYCAANPSK